MIPWLASVVSAVLVFLSFEVSLARGDSLRTPLGEGPVEEFSLTDSRGGAFRPEQLRGKVWVAHFFFTTCAGGCSKTNATMAHLQEVFRGHPHLALVSISINHDAPEVLGQFSEDQKAEPGQWHFLTGPQQETHRIMQKVFFQAVDAYKKEAGYEWLHDFKLVLVDEAGHRVGYVDGREVDSRPELEDRIRELLRRRQAAQEPGRVWFPRINAALNGLCGVLLVAGYLAIRYRRETLHMGFMVAALGVSAVFLGCYLYYHFVILDGRPTGFRGEGWVRGAYFGILISHTILAALVPPLAIYVTVQGFQDRRARHVRLARWTLPVWLYVSVTGVVVYWMLYHLYPPF